MLFLRAGGFFSYCFNGLSSWPACMLAWFCSGYGFCVFWTFEVVLALWWKFLNFPQLNWMVLHRSIFFFKSSAGCCFYIHNWNKFPPHHHPIDTAWADLCCTAIKSINDLYLSLFWISVISPTVFSTFVYSYTVWVNKCFRVTNVMFSCLPFFKIELYNVFCVLVNTIQQTGKKGIFCWLDLEPLVILVFT